MNTYVQGIQVELFQEYTKKKDLWDDFHPKFVSRSNEKKKKNKKFIIYVPFVLRIKKKNSNYTYKNTYRNNTILNPLIFFDNSIP